MQAKSLDEFCSAFGQSEAAKVVDCTQGAISQMRGASRLVYFVPVNDGFDAYEIKKLSGPKKVSLQELQQAIDLIKEKIHDSPQP